jgi:hypothetical protein
MNGTLELALAIVALILAAIEEFRAQGQSLLAWAVIVLAALAVTAHL